jgi:hypothetical protein
LYRNIVRRFNRVGYSKEIIDFDLFIAPSPARTSITDPSAQKGAQTLLSLINEVDLFFSFLLFPLVSLFHLSFTHLTISQAIRSKIRSQISLGLITDANGRTSIVCFRYMPPNGQRTN